jgi:hypothetical protein
MQTADRWRRPRQPVMMMRKLRATTGFRHTRSFPDRQVGATETMSSRYLLCYQDPTHFYYAHLGAKADPHACQIFIVNDAPRTMITVDQAKGTPWTEGWHNVKVERTVSDGSVKVYFDDMKKAYMTARDKTFTWGQIGIGTFDDHGNFDDVVLRGKKVERAR